MHSAGVEEREREGGRESEAKREGNEEGVRRRKRENMGICLRQLGRYTLLTMR